MPERDHRGDGMTAAEDPRPEPETRLETELEPGVLGSQAARISNSIVQLFARYGGRGPTKARTTLNTNIAVIVMEDSLTRSEQTLAGAGQFESVAQMRRVFQGAIRDEATRAVEEITGRSVVSCLSDIDVEANVAVQVFLFERAPESGLVSVSEADVEPGP
jgi:uncharacterized protein YbcI